MRPITINRTLVGAAVGAICAVQTTGGAQNLLINGTLASGGVATMAAQQQIGITSVGDIHAVVFTVTGTDGQGRVISETITGVNTNTVNSVLNYKTVTSIATSAAVASAVTVDTLQLGSSQEIPLDLYLTPFNVTLAAEVIGTINYTVQWTTDDVYASSGPFVWNSAAANLTGATTSQVGSLISPVTAVRVLTNSGGGTVNLRVVQAGVFG